MKQELTPGLRKFIAVVISVAYIMGLAYASYYTKQDWIFIVALLIYAIGSIVFVLLKGEWLMGTKMKEEKPIRHIRTEQPISRIATKRPLSKKEVGIEIDDDETVIEEEIEEEMEIEEETMEEEPEETQDETEEYNMAKILQCGKEIRLLKTQLKLKQEQLLSLIK